MIEKHKNRSSWLFSQSLDRRNTSSILQKQNKKRNTSFMNELYEIAAEKEKMNDEYGKRRNF